MQAESESIEMVVHDDYGQDSTEYNIMPTPAVVGLGLPCSTSCLFMIYDCINNKFPGKYINVWPLYTCIASVWTRSVVSHGTLVSRLPWSMHVLGKAVHTFIFTSMWLFLTTEQKCITIATKQLPITASYKLACSSSASSSC